MWLVVAAGSQSATATVSVTGWVVATCSWASQRPCRSPLRTTGGMRRRPARRARPPKRPPKRRCARRKRRRRRSQVHTCPQKHHHFDTLSALPNPTPLPSSCLITCSRYIHILQRYRRGIVRAGRISDDTVPECLSRADALTHSRTLYVCLLL